MAQCMNCHQHLTVGNVICGECVPQLVVVVRCVECKYWHENTAWCEKHSSFIDHDGEPCSPSESSNWKMFNSTDFCSCGERRESENER